MEPVLIVAIVRKDSTVFVSKSAQMAEPPGSLWPICHLHLPLGHPHPGSEMNTGHR